MPVRIFSNVIGFDDSPFERSHRGNVNIVGAVFAGTRFDGVLFGHVRRDGANASEKTAELVSDSKFAEHAQLVMLQGIALAGFNVVDINWLNRTLNIPILVVARRNPDLAKIKKVLLKNVPGGNRKWRIIEKIGPMERAGKVFVQRAGLSMREAEETIQKFSIHGNIPEPLRAAHLIAGGVTLGQSRGRT